MNPHAIVRLEPAGAKTWRVACACGWTSEPREKRNLAAVDGVRHCNPELQETKK